MTQSDLNALNLLEYVVDTFDLSPGLYDDLNKVIARHLPQSWGCFGPVMFYELPIDTKSNVVYLKDVLR